MKQIITFSVIAVLTVAFSRSTNAQTLYVPSGTGGIGSSSGSPNTNIGIGTSTPSNYLAGTNGLTLFGTYPGLAFARSAKTWLLYVQADNSFRLFENDANLDRITVLPGGNLGINTITPTAKLQVQNGSVLFDGVTGTTPVSGAGTRMMWIPAKGSFRTGYISSDQWDDVNIGINSFATGNDTKASGSGSFAMGLATTASGGYSTTFGGFTIASGQFSTAFGTSTVAQSLNSFVTGRYNYNPGTHNPNTWIATEPLFEIGNGTSPSSRSNAVTVLKNGNVGLSTTTPTAKLQVQNGSVLFDGTTGTTPVSGGGTRMMWIPAKGAFRAGVVTAQWDDANIGLNSFATGNDTKASGQASFAAGLVTTASGGYSTAFGGFATASGEFSTAFGANTVAQSLNSFVIGRYNYNPGTYNPTTWVATDALFVIGNGTGPSSRSNAVTVLKNGNTGIGVSNPDAILHLVKPAGSTANYVFRVDASGTTPPFIIDAGGNVGIGLTVSSSKLEIRGNTNTNLSSSLNVRNNVGSSILKVRDDGKVTVGAVPDNKIVGNYSLYVENGILVGMCKIANINTADWSDFVFYDDYNLMPLYEVEKFIKKHKHLPDVPSASEVSKTGIDVAKMDALLLQKIEELTLYNIQLQKQIDELNKQMENRKASK